MESIFLPLFFLFNLSTLIHLTPLALLCALKKVTFLLEIVDIRKNLKKQESETEKEIERDKERDKRDRA